MYTLFHSLTHTLSLSLTHSLTHIHTCSIGDNSFIIKTKQYCEMLEGNILAPYKFKKVLGNIPCLILMYYSTGEMHSGVQFELR